MYQLSTWNFILENLMNSTPVLLLCVVDSKGSSPGRSGFKMAVTKKAMSGSIGGGIMEHKFVELALDKLKTIHPDTILKKQVHSKSAKMNQSGMICSGEQTVILFALNESNIKTIEKIIFILKENKNVNLIITPDQITFSENTDVHDYLFDMKSEKEWSYQEKLGYKNHLYVIGAGHCSLAFTELMSKMDFYIHLLDDREGLNTFEENNFVHEKKIVPDYRVLNQIISSGKNVYVVIMTFGYRSDDIALRALIDKDFKYLGVLGSQTKIEKLFEEWRAGNLPEEKLKLIHAPIGINISSQTPEEIAVSIAAEIISIKNKN
jgi:xanthine dehydrogenase accessory factor